MIHFQFDSWLEKAKKVKKSSASKQKAKPKSKATQNVRGQVFLLGPSAHKSSEHVIANHALPWQKQALLDEKKNVLFFHSNEGPVWILKLGEALEKTHQSLLSESFYGQARDLMGAQFHALKASQADQVELIFEGTDHEQELGALVALDLSVYSYKDIVQNKKIELPELVLTKKGGHLPLEEAQRLARATNTARHLVSLPPNVVNPTNFAKWVQNIFKKSQTIRVDVWNHQKLTQENMNLHLSVGQGSAHPPCLVKISYQPQKKSKEAPLAFVGKGITFDTGGLDLKPSSGMRLMKKDMGGSAAVVALAQWAMESHFPHPLEFYLALAENSVGSRAFRPSDVIEARNGMRVEIDNTDAEGRLVLADALDVAVTEKRKPQIVVDIATLTGAIKVGLGSEIAGLFSNNDELAKYLNEAGLEAGDLNWRMPLFDRYWGSMSSPFADFKNSGDGFGGAITAALFLQKFTRDVPWAHLDIYAWNDRAQGALQGPGGSGQPVQALVRFLHKWIQ